MSPLPTGHSVLDTLQQQKTALPSFRFDCGTEAPLLEPNRTLHRALLAANIDHNYAEYPGGHEWPYWEAHLADTLRFFSEHL